MVLHCDDDDGDDWRQYINRGEPKIPGQIQAKQNEEDGAARHNRIQRNGYGPVGNEKQIFRGKGKVTRKRRSGMLRHLVDDHRWSARK
jgi:hypothetical protein